MNLADIDVHVQADTRDLIGKRYLQCVKRVIDEFRELRLSVPRHEGGSGNVLVQFLQSAAWLPIGSADDNFGRIKVVADPFRLAQKFGIVDDLHGLVRARAQHSLKDWPD